LLDLLLRSFLLFPSSCSTCYSALLVQLVAPLFLFDLLRSSCSTCYSAPLAWLVASLFLLSLLFCSSCSTYCSAPLAWLVAFLLFNLLLCFSCLTSLFKYLSATPMTLLLLVPFAWPCCFAPFVSDWYSPHLFFIGVECGGVVQIRVLQIQVFHAKLGKGNFLCSILICWWFYFFKTCFWEMVVSNVFVFLCKNYLDIVHLILHIAFHFYTLHFICTIVLCIFWAHCIFFSFNCL